MREHQIQILKAENRKLKDEIDLLKQDIDRLLKSKKILKAFVKENRLIRDKFTRQGFRYDEHGWGWHYLVFPITGIPGSIDIRDSIQLIEESLKPYLDKESGEYAGYRIESINYSERKERWYVQIRKMIDSKKRKAT